MDNFEQNYHACHDPHGFGCKFCFDPFSLA
jgi:hypothetical protein